MIGNLVKNEVFKCFERGDFKEGTRILSKISKRMDESNSTEEYRMVYYNLAWVQEELGKLEEAKLNIQKIKSLIEKDVVYKENYLTNYFKVLMLYDELFKDNLNVDEKVNLNREILKCCHRDIDNIDIALTCKFTIYEVQNDFDGMKDVIEEIHTYVCFTTEFVGKTKEETKSLIEKIKAVRKQALSKFKDKDADQYKDFCEELFNLTNSSIAI